MIDIGCLVVVGVVTWMVAAEGIWGAAQIFLAVLFSALVAFNFFEPLAIVLGRFIPDQYSDYVALVGLFTVVVFVLRLAAEQIAQTYIQVIPAVDTAGRWAFGVLTGYVTMAFLLAALHTAPLPREFAGFAPERNNFLGMAPDRQLLGFMQYVSERPLCWQYRENVAGQSVLVSNAFDGRFESVGSPNKPYTARDGYGREVPQLVWPSFPIRYALRRERLSVQGGAAVQNPSQQPVVIAPPVAAPAAPAPKGGAPVETQSGF